MKKYNRGEFYPGACVSVLNKMFFQWIAKNIEIKPYENNFSNKIIRLTSNVKY